jgi:hypothetical protein
MKKLLLLCTALVAIVAFAHANDLIVEESGLPPSYSSITAAVAAANSGDRIFIKNKAGNLPWLESITITKSLTLLAFTYDSFFVVQGSYIISPSVADTVNIIGMINLSGGISASANAPAGARSAVRIFDTQLNSGSINFPYNNWDVTVEGCYLQSGYIAYEHGSIIGNQINNAGNSYAIQVASESNNTTDTSYIMGNKIVTTTYSGEYGIYWASSTMYFDIRNNYIQASEYGIYITPTSSGTSTNKLYNNTVSIANSGSSTNYGIYVFGSSGSTVDIQNNVVDRNDAVNYTYYGIYTSTGGTLTLTYNYVDDAFNYPIGGSATVSLNNVTSTAIALNANGSTQANVGLNGGNPGTSFYDTDLTVNDAGCYGGSFTLSNYNLFGNYPSTWLTNYQFNVRTGNTLGIKAYSFSR